VPTILLISLINKINVYDYRDANRLMKDKDGNTGQQMGGINGT